MLDVKNLSAGYGQKPVLHDVSMNVADGEFVLVIGANGSGKSTMLKCIAGLLRPDRKSAIKYRDKDIAALPAEKHIRLGLVYVPQRNNVFDQLTVSGNLEVSALALPKTVDRRASIERVLELLPRLQPLRRRSAFGLSGGERQSLALAIALIHRPKLLLLDEPCAGLDPVMAHDMLRSIKELQHRLKFSVLMVEHRLKESWSLADRVYGLRAGVVVRSISQRVELTPDLLADVFL